MLFEAISSASCPDVSLSMKMYAQRKAGRRQWAVPFPWSLAAHHFSLAFRARLYHAKNEARKEEAAIALNQVDEYDDCTQPCTKQFRVNGRGSKGH